MKVIHSPLHARHDGGMELYRGQLVPCFESPARAELILAAVRNLFRDEAADASIYDEVLVIRPPKRVVTGLLVRF